MPIKSMKCKYCGSDDCNFMLCSDKGTIYLNKDGYVTYAGVDSDSKIKNGNHISKFLSKIDIKYTLGSCNGRCEDESSLIITFDDGIKFKNDEEKAFEKFIGELKNLISSVKSSVKSSNKSVIKSSTTKISTDHLKTLIPQYVKEHFGDGASNALSDAKNWKRISKIKSGNEILRIFEYKLDTEIKLYITSNAQDTEIINYKFQDGNVISQNTNKTKIKTEAKYVFGTYNDPYSDDTAEFTSIVIATKECWKNGCIGDQDLFDEIEDLFESESEFTAYGYGNKYNYFIFLSDKESNEVKKILQQYPEFEYDKKFEKFCKEDK